MSTSRTAPHVGEGKRGTEGHIAYLLRQAGAAVRATLDAELAAIGVTGAQFLVLTLLDAYPGISGAELARLTQLTPQTINLVVRKLERDALIGRAPHETHGRVLRMELTAKGRQALARCKRTADAVEQRMRALLDAPREAVVRRWLVDLAQTLAPETRTRSARARRR